MTAPQSHEATELYLHTTSTEGLYRLSVVPTLDNLAKKIVKGSYDSTRALIAWGHVATKAAKNYHKMHCDNSVAWFEIFPVAALFRVATELQEYFAEQLADIVTDLQAKKA